MNINNPEIIATMFSFYKNEDNSMEFANGEYCMQRDKKFYYQLIDTIIQAVALYETWILEHYNNWLSQTDVMGWSKLGRYLDDSGSYIYKYWGRQGNICRTCYREWGQMYYANNCNHTGNPPTVGA